MFTISTDQRSILINIHIYTYIHAHTYTQKMCIYIAFLLFLLLFSDQQRFFLYVLTQMMLCGTERATWKIVSEPTVAP